LPAHLADALALRLFRHAERWLQRGAKELWLDPQPVDPVIRDVPDWRTSLSVFVPVCRLPPGRKVV